MDRWMAPRLLTGRVHQAFTSLSKFIDTEIDPRITTLEGTSHTHPARPEAHVYNNAAIAVGDATATWLSFNSVALNVGGMFDAGIPDRFTIVEAGRYLITAAVGFEANATGFRQFRLLLNGGSLMAVDQRRAVDGSGTSCSLVRDLRLAQNDYVQVVVYQNSGGTLNIQASPSYSPEFTAYRIS